MRALLLGLVALVSGLGILAYLAVDTTPLVLAHKSMRPQDVAELKALLQPNSTRHAIKGSLQQLRLTEAQANRVLDGLSLFPQLAGAHLDLGSGSANLTASLRIRPTPFGRYINLRALLVQTDSGGVRIRHLRVGHVAIPRALANPLAELAWRHLASQPSYGALTAAVQGISFAPDALTLSYRLTPQLFSRFEQQSANLLLNPDDQNRLLQYGAHLRQILKQHPQHSRADLASIIGPMFAYAHSLDGDPAQENRTVWLTLSSYLTGVSLPQLLAGRSYRRAPGVALLLYGRQDAAEHFVVAATLAATAGPALARDVSLAKEEDDLLHGSGFSFTDLGWDLAGVRIGEASVNPGTAAQMQAMLASARNDGDLSPSFRDLPEFLGPAAFRKRFERIDSPAFHAMMATITQRLDDHPLTREAALKPAS